MALHLSTALSFVCREEEKNMVLGCFCNFHFILIIVVKLYMFDESVDVLMRN